MAQQQRDREEVERQQEEREETQQCLEHEDRDLSSEVGRWNLNMDALRTLKEIEAEGREPSEQEREAMRRFAGFGDTGFNQTDGRRLYYGFAPGLNPIDVGNNG